MSKASVPDFKSYLLGDIVCMCLKIIIFHHLVCKLCSSWRVELIMCVAHAGRDEHKSRSLSYLDDDEVDKTLTHKCIVMRVEKPRQQNPF